MTSSRIRACVRILGVAAAVCAAVLVVLALVVTPADAELGNTVRIMYVHVPSAVTTYLAVFVTALGSALYLLKRSCRWDRIAAASAEIAAVFCGLALITGMLWGRPTWGVYWVWDARLTTFALLFIIIIGYLAVRRLPADPTVRSKRAAIIGLVGAANIPIVHKAVAWWGGLHQSETTLGTVNVQIGGSMRFTLLFGMLTFVLIYSWLLARRVQVEELLAHTESAGLAAAIAERRAEAEHIPVSR